jgi:hypothetical protein
MVTEEREEWLQNLALDADKEEIEKRRRNLSAWQVFRATADIFAEESWSSLPERKIWDHAIKLTEDAKVLNYKVCLMSRSEQTELDAYIDKHLLTGCKPSKSLMASPCFFIKKKDGKLCFVQDYHKLNVMTVKNHYPVLLIPELVKKLHSTQYFYGATRTSESRKAMNGKQPSGVTKDSLNHW